MRGWATTRLGEAIVLQRGYDLPEHKRRLGTVPVIGSAGHTGWHDEARVKAPGVVVGRAGASAGAVTYVKEDFWPHNATLYVKDFRGNDPKFISYLLQTLPFDDLNSGSAQQMLNRNYAYLLPIKLPSLDTQCRIASILSAYDDLIEVNRRRVAILEDMARRLFEEWFVHLRFPGHAITPVHDTPNGPVPERWRTCAIGDAFTVLGGGTPNKANPLYWEGGTYNWFTPTDLTTARSTFMDASFSKITLKGLQDSSTKLFPSRCVMMTSRATIGAIAINTTPACTNQGFIVCQPNEAVPLHFMRLWLQRQVPTFIAHATGATFKEITKGVFKRLPITLPPPALLANFEAQATPIMEQVLVLGRANTRLAAARDLLLPRLLSGQLSSASAFQAPILQAAE